VTEPRHLLVVFHSRSGGTAAMADAVIAGATSDDVEAVEVRVRNAFDADADDLRWAEALILGTPENFGYMSGALKDFFDRTYYSVINETQGLPYALFIKAGSDGDGALRSIERLVTGLKWKAALPPLVVTGELTDEDLERCHELGLTLAAGLEAGVF
jgi:multimeric flavodoxin WrbA